MGRWRDGTTLGRMRIGDIEPQDNRDFWSDIKALKTYQRNGEGAKGNVSLGSRRGDHDEQRTGGT